MQIKPQCKHSETTGSTRWAPGRASQDLGEEKANLGFGGGVGHAVWLVGSQFDDQGSNPCPLLWELGVSTTGLAGKS